MAQDALDFQSHAVGAGEVEDHRARLAAYRQDLEDVIAGGPVEAANLDRSDLVEKDAGECPLEEPAAVERRLLPAEAVCDQNEAPLLGQERHLADRDERVLQDRRDDSEILLVDGA